MSVRRRLLREESESESAEEQVFCPRDVASSSGAQRDLLAEIKNLEFDGSMVPVKAEPVGLEEEAGGEQIGAAARAGPRSSYLQSGRLRVADNLHFVRQEWLKTLMGGPSLVGSRDVCFLMENHRIGDIEFKIPGPFDRPWRAPEGYFSVYEAYFSVGDLKFPLPELLVEYCHQRRLAISQLSASAIFNFVSLCDMASVEGVEMDLGFLEEITLLCKCDGYPGAYHLRMKHDIICRAPSKLKDWKRRFFYVKKNQASLAEDRLPVRREWNPVADRHPVGRPLRADFFKDVEKIKELSISQFQQIAKTREQRRQAMAGQGSEGSRKRKSAEQGRTDPPKKSSSVPHRSEPPRGPSSDHRVRIDRGLEAKRLADARRAETKGKAPSGETFGALPNLPGARTESREVLAIPPKPVEEESQVAPEEGESHMAKKLAPEEGESHMAKNLASLEVVSSAAEKSPAQDAGKTAELDDEQPTAGGGDSPSVGEGREEETGHLFDSASARDDFLQFRFVGPGPLCTDLDACSELLYSLRGSGDPFPALAQLSEREGYRRYARLQVRSMMVANGVFANYDEKLTRAQKELAERYEEADWLRSQLVEAEKVNAEREMEADRLKAQLEAAEKEKEESARLRDHEKEESARLRDHVKRLQDWILYSKKVEVPSKKASQIRGIVGNLELLRDKKNVDVPQRIIDKLVRERKKFEAQVCTIPKADLADEDLH